jgi:dolichol-phosphate mannosyltransferase|tara:strand:- start:548 stop:1252 length:705 start_codon:yes stop_codon:yes gene_type:complete
MKISVVIPCYNEEQNLEIPVTETIRYFKENKIPGEVVIVDDGSFDNTRKVAEKLSVSNPEIKVISHKNNRGLGQACLTGFLNARGKWVTWVPGDGQLYPEDMINMCNSADGVEFAIGMVPITERLVSDNLWRFVLSKSWRLIIKGLLRFDVNDIVGYAFRRKLLSNITLISSTGFLNLEFPIKAIKSGVKVKHYNIRLKPRISGKSKVNNISTIIKSFWEIIKHWFVQDLNTNR